MKPLMNYTADLSAACTAIQYKQLLDTLPDMLCILDGCKKVIFSNKSFQEHLNFSENEIIGLSILDFMIEEDRQAGEKAFRDSILKTGHAFFYGRMLTKNGIPIPLSCEINYQEREEIYFLRSTVRIKNEKEILQDQYEKKLKEHKRQLNNVLERIGEGFIAVDEQLRIIYWNYQAERILGRKREDVLTRHIWKCYPEAVQTSFYTFFNKALKEQKPQRYEAFLSIEEKWLEVILYPSESGMTGFFRDISERKRLEEELQHQKKEHQRKITSAVIKAQEKERAYVGQELHDNVNQVLTTIKLYTELCLSKAPNANELLEKSLELLQSCITEIRNLSWQLSAPTLGKIRMKDSVQELVNTITETGKTAIMLNTDRIADLEVGEELHLAIYRILQEHMTNILKHAEAKKVEITIDRLDDELIIKITDNGKGFNPADRKTGIGISNMISRAESMGGRLSVNSAPGLGCVLIAHFSL